jgi:hypothetical protein
MKEYEILDKDDGYWILDSQGYEQGPYDSIKDCHDDLPPTADIQYPLSMLLSDDNDYLG